jgi:hypothetical protein
MREAPPTNTWSGSSSWVRGVDQAVGVVVARLGRGADVGQRAADQMRRQARPRGAEPLVARLVVQLQRALLDRAVGQHGHHEGDVRRQADDLHGADGGRLMGRADDDGGIVRQVGEQPAGVVEHALQLAVGRPEEVPDLLAAGGVEGAGGAELVDEEAVALVGGDAACAGVGLGEVALALEHGHLVADGRRRNGQAALAHDVLRPHGLGRLDVLRHHGAENGRLAIVEHPGTRLYRLLTASPRRRPQLWRT